MFKVLNIFCKMMKVALDAYAVATVFQLHFSLMAVLLHGRLNNLIPK